MTQPLDRRQFLATSASVAAGVAMASGRGAQAQEPFKHKLYKALIVGKPTADELGPMKEAGFDGVEAHPVSPEEAAQAKAVADGLGMKIHSVLRGWAKFNSDNAEEVEASIQQTVAALRAAQGYGADAILLVPCRIGGQAMPAPWDFKIEFDEGTGHLTKVADGDNAPFADYIAAHDHAYDTSRTAIEKLIPVAEETGIFIAVENVWNNLFVDPRHLAHFADSFESPWVKVYFDIGNHAKYSPPEQWIPVLGERIAKCHVKDFKLNEDGHDGKFVDIRDGSVNWPVVRRALDDIGYDGWMTIEGSGGLSMEEKGKRLDLIIAGQ
jgi:L-ribulose-5-phosphate 3-epimerase